MSTLQRILGHAKLEATRRCEDLSEAELQIKQNAFSSVEKLELKE